MERVFNIMDFGAVPDSDVDSTAAIQAAIDAAGEVTGTVVVPPGTYCCAGLQMRAGVRLEGKSAWRFRGVGQSILKLNRDDVTCMLDVTNAIGCTISGVCMQGEKLGKCIHGVYLSYDYFANGRQEDTVAIDDCQIEKFSGDGVHFNRVWCFSVRHSMLCRNRNGLLVYGWDGFLLDNWFTGNGNCGMLCEPEAASLTCTGNRVEWNGGAGFSLRNTNALNITGNYFDHSGKAGLDLCNDDNSRSVNITVTGNIIYRNGKRALTSGDEHDCCQVRMRRCVNTVISGNSFAVGTDDQGRGAAAPRFGVVYETLRGCSIVGNVMEHGALEELFVDLGGHTGAVLVKDNVGDPVGDDPELFAHI